MRLISYYIPFLFYVLSFINHIYASIDPSEILENILDHKTDLIDTVIIKQKPRFVNKYKLLLYRLKRLKESFLMILVQNHILNDLMAL